MSCVFTDFQKKVDAYGVHFFVYNILRHIFKTGLGLTIRVALLMGRRTKNLGSVNALNLCYKKT